MVPELERPRVTEIQVRMDCNGCVQKIKKALHGVDGIYDLHIDVPQQKLTVVGRADPEKILKAIRKTRKIATICSHSEPTDPSAQPPEQPPEGTPPAPETANQPPPAEEQQGKAAPQAELPPQAEPPRDQPPPENPPTEATPAPASGNINTSQPGHTPRLNNVGEVHVIHHNPPNYGYIYDYGHSYSGHGHWSRHPNVQSFPPQPPQPIYVRQPEPPSGQSFSHEQPHPIYGRQHEQPNAQNSPHDPPQPIYMGQNEPPQPIYVTHSYNTYRPSPYIIDHQYIHSPPPYLHYSWMDYYNEENHSNGNNNGNITSIFSDENPNACRIM
ncbi:hypothetical protein SLEP1_g49 [Rubroshorea leprosula]|uniref:HMA domain-containing protein n=1 Tax=Rubroshorea leprosula TaxID=152421 RepID=A0AAV5HF78_9ROSI|nr:hypothetical protein SLEP1_g49 [Rubroshorea leprosula]